MKRDEPAAIAPASCTLEALLRRFNSPTVPLELVAREFFGLGKEKAYEYAAVNRLAIPTFRACASAKAPLQVHLEDLAGLLDRQRLAARAEWEKNQLR